MGVARQALMTFELRSYQAPLIEQAEALMLDRRVPCIVAPTGAGKTVLLAETARRALARGEKVVAVCHRGEIIEQLVASLTRHLGKHVPIEVVRAGSRSRLAAPVVVGMVPTMARRLHKLSPLQGRTLLQDECHHAGAASWDAVTEAIAPRRRCGFTATPIRPDGKGMGDAGGFTDLVLGPHPGELMALGALCRYRMFATPRQLNTKGMRKQSTGDFRVSDMEAKVVDINGDVVRDWRRFNPEGHRTIAVGVSVLHAYELMRLYREAGITAEAVDGKTPAGERKAIFARFRSGATTVLCACAVIDEGLDVPEATCLQITRPTASIRLYRQLIGRVLRPAPGKTEALIIDHTDNWERMPLPDAVIDWSLFQEKVEVQEKPRKADPETGEIKEVEIIEEAEEAPGVNQNGVELVEITAELLANSRPIVARKMLNERLAAELQAVEAGVMAAENLRSWVSRTEVLDDELIHRLGVALGMAPGWSAGQVMLNLLQTRQQETQAIKRLQRVA